MPSRKVVLSIVSTLALMLATVSLTSAYGIREDQPTPIARGPHVSGVVQVMAHRPGSAGPSAGNPATSTASSGTVATDSASTGRPVNETSIATNGSLIVAGANDYNSYNGQGQDGYYWSVDGTTWNDAGPIDVFPHNNNNGAGDPGLAVDSSGVVYYSSLFFNFYRCGVGGVELLRRDANGSWTYYQIAANSQSQFQDKPALALDEANHQVFVSWTQFNSCSGANVTSPIRVAVLKDGSTSVAPSQILLDVPGSSYSQGSSIQPDGTGGFWIAWEEWSSASTSAKSWINLAHWSGGGWSSEQTISPTGFADLPDPLPGFAFRDNSFPVLTMVGNQPWVTWTSADSGTGRAYVWNGSSTLITVSNTGGDQFFPAIAADGSGGAYVSYSQTNPSQGTYDQYLADVTSGTPTSAMVSSASSDPSRDAFFGGKFIGDYNGITVVGGVAAMPIWTQISQPDPNYPGLEMDSETVPVPISGSGGGGGGGSTTSAPGAPTSLSAIPSDTLVTLSWTPPSDSGSSTITSYNIYRGTTSTGETLLDSVGGSQTSYPDGAVTNGVTYYYYVTAVNGVGEGSASNEASATPTASTAVAPSAPSYLDAQPANGKGVQLTWGAASTDGGSAIVGYNVYRDNGSGYVLVAALGNVTSYKDTHTGRGASYTYEVKAVNSDGIEGPAASAGPVMAT